MKVKVRFRAGEAAEEFELAAEGRLWGALADRFGGDPTACVLSVEVAGAELRVDARREDAGRKVVCCVDAAGRLVGQHVLGTRDQAAAVAWARTYCSPFDRWFVREVEPRAEAGR